MKVIVIDEDSSVSVRTVVDTGFSALPGRYRVVMRGPDGEDDNEVTPWMSAEEAEKRLHWEASLRGLWVRDLRAFDQAGACVLVVECDRQAAAVAWKSV